MTAIPKSRAEAETLDSADVLAPARALFVPQPGLAYLDGHSLGPPTRAALAAVERGAREGWARGLVGAWNEEGWIDLPERVGAKIAPLIGASPAEVIVTDSVSVNLFKLAGAALPLVRSKVVMVERGEFPTDAYVADGLAALAGAEARLVPAGTGADEVTATGGVLIKSVAAFRTGEVSDVAAHEAAARGAGGLVVWDLSHAVGIVPLDLREDGARLAAGCTYKYLNGGPGAPGFVYASDDIAPELRNPVAGWFGHAAPFAFDLAYAPREGAARFAAGTPPILSLLALDAALGAFEGVPRAALWEKAGVLGDMILERAASLGMSAQVPKDRRKRGGHVALSHQDGYALIRALIARGVQGDFREPDTVRFGLSPLPLSYAQAWDACEVLDEVVRTRAYDRPEYRRRGKVT